MLDKYVIVPDCGATGVVSEAGAGVGTVPFPGLRDLNTQLKSFVLSGCNKLFYFTPINFKKQLW